jgi:hypothetical protein
MQHRRQKKAGQIAVSGRLLVATVVGAGSSEVASKGNNSLHGSPPGRWMSTFGACPLAS